MTPGHAERIILYSRAGNRDARGWTITVGAEENSEIDGAEARLATADESVVLEAALARLRREGRALPGTIGAVL